MDEIRLSDHFGYKRLIRFTLPTIAMMICTSVYSGYSTGVAPVISFHYGAGNREELHNLFVRSLKLMAVILFIMASVSELSAGLQAQIFVSYDKELEEFTTHAVRLYSLSYFISGFNIFASSFFTALNNGLISALISFSRTFLFLVTAILAMPLIFGMNGIWLAVVAAETASLAVSAICLKLNRKKYQY